MLTHLIIIFVKKLNIKTNLLEEYVNFVDTTKKQNKYFKIVISLIVIVIGLFLFIFLFKYNTKWYLYKYRNNYIIIHI